LVSKYALSKRESAVVRLRVRTMPGDGWMSPVSVMCFRCRLSRPSGHSAAGWKFQWPHRESNPQPFSLQRSAATYPRMYCHFIRTHSKWCSFTLWHVELRKLITVIIKAYQLIYLESFQFISYFYKILVSAVHHSSTVHNEVSTGENQLSVVCYCSFNEFVATLNISGCLDLYHIINPQ
jgi:hypothetical protein